jgi:hypothetical protein
MSTAETARRAPALAETSREETSDSLRVFVVENHPDTRLGKQKRMSLCRSRGLGGDAPT